MVTSTNVTRDIFQAFFFNDATEKQVVVLQRVTIDPPAGATTYKAANQVTLDGISSGAASDITVKACQSIVINNGTRFTGPLTAIATPTACD